MRGSRRRCTSLPAFADTSPRAGSAASDVRAASTETPQVPDAAEAMPGSEKSAASDETGAVKQIDHADRIDSGTKRRMRGPAVAQLTAGDQRFLNILLAGFLTIFMVEWFVLVSRRPAELPLQRGQPFEMTFRVDINRATWIDWMQLEGIGPALAHRIEADRRLNGPFRSIDDLRRVSGIGPVTLERIRSRLVVTGDSNSDPSASDR